VAAGAHAADERRDRIPPNEPEECSSANHRGRHTPWLSPRRSFRLALRERQDRDRPLLALGARSPETVGESRTEDLGRRSRTDAQVERIVRGEAGCCAYRDYGEI
jgi:hypothetical protein